MKRRLLLLLLVTIGFSSAAQSQVIETSRGKVEFIGLEQWTPGMIQTKLGHSSNDALHFCAADLRKKLGFADSVVDVSLEDGKLYTIIAVVEPQYADHVRYRPEPSSSSPAPLEWRDLLPVVEQNRALNNLLDYGQTLKGAIKVEKPYLQDSDLDKTWWPLLGQRRSERDYRQALARLGGDSDYRNRMIAAMILTNFAERDGAWLALMDGVRDKNHLVNSACYQALITLTTYVPRKVDWAKAAHGIRHILSGTNLFAFKHVLKTLTTTKVSAKLAPVLLGSGRAKLLLAYLRAEHKDEKEAARRFLVQLSGKDFGYDGEKWRAWVERPA
ncbi:MAG TPA: hypothetical protein VER76_14205 [Pyrinomonadaceae bacterium]|nr:hypothetical protein [Pyrinomonadaceae bacterium]